MVGHGLFEIDGVPAAVLREFSRRRVEIEERAGELTGMAAAELSRERLQGIALTTRKAKEHGVDGAGWEAEARARAAEQGFGRRELERLRGRSAVVADRPEAGHHPVSCPAALGPGRVDVAAQHVRAPTHAGRGRRRIRAGRQRRATRACDQHLPRAPVGRRPRHCRWGAPLHDPRPARRRAGDRQSSRAAAERERGRARSGARGPLWCGPF
jgi:hypothetical protein